MLPREPHAGLWVVATAGSIDPIGPKLSDLRAQSDSLFDYVRTAQELTSLRDLDAALAP